MAISLQKFGSRVRIFKSNFAPQYPDKSEIEITYRVGYAGNNVPDSVDISIRNGTNFGTFTIDQIIMNGNAIEDQESFETELAVLFSEEGGGSATPNIQQVLDAGNLCQNQSLTMAVAGSVYQSGLSPYGLEFDYQPQNGDGDAYTQVNSQGVGAVRFDTGLEKTFVNQMLPDGFAIGQSSNDPGFRLINFKQPERAIYAENRLIRLPEMINDESGVLPYTAGQYAEENITDLCFGCQTIDGIKYLTLRFNGSPTVHKIAMENL
jgi:hypothetical protein